MAELSVVQELIQNRKWLPAVVKFHKSLRQFGMIAKSLIDRTKYMVPKQFKAAAMVSYSEIQTANTRIIERAEKILYLKYKRRNKHIEVLDFYISFGRLIMLFDLERSFHLHGEARLFDYDGKFLKRMKKRFYEYFPEEEKYVILVFSHYMPCTAPNHYCSSLIRGFAETYKEEFIISYFAVDSLTNPEIAWDDMRRSPYIYCIHARDVKFGPKPFPVPTIEEKIESQCANDECLRSFETNSARFKKRCRWNKKFAIKQKENNKN